jgi:hypothetical protein
MNERIKQLVKQAGATLNEGFHQNVVGITMTPKELEKFAELIVAECLKIAKNREDELESAGLLSESNAVGNVSYRISRQFGVKR